MPFKKGHPPYYNPTGKKHTEETKKKISEAHKGKHHSPDTEFKKGMSSWHKGKKIDRELYPNFGHNKPHTAEAKLKMSKSKKGKHYSPDTEFKEKEGDLSYSGLHQWVSRKLGKPTVCEHCGEKKKRLYWANKSRLYKKNTDDWISLCASCHYKYDRKEKNEENKKATS